MKTFSWLLVAGMLLIALGCEKKRTDGAKGGPQTKALRIAVIPKGTSHEFWKSVEAGAKAAGKELGAEIIWKGPQVENDRDAQIKIVQQFTAEGVSGIVLAPLDDTALKRPAREAMDGGIPVVIFDSALQGDVGKDFVSFVATNNRKGGQLAGERMAKLLNNQGKVVLLRYQENSASTTEREAGFLDVIEKTPITVILKNRYGGAGIDSAKTEAMNQLDKLREADGIFCPNESSTLGMLGALKQNSLAGPKKFVGFDASPTEVDAMRKGEIHALVAQDPYKMGYEGVKTMVNHLRGTKVDPVVDTGVKLIDSTNVDTPEIKALLGIK